MSTASAKPARLKTEKLEVDLYLEGLDHSIEDSKDENSKTFFRNLKVLISDLFVEAQPAAERTALKDEINALRARTIMVNPYGKVKRSEEWVRKKEVLEAIDAQEREGAQT